MLVCGDLAPYEHMPTNKLAWVKRPFCIICAYSKSWNEFDNYCMFYWNDHLPIIHLRRDAGQRGAAFLLRGFFIFIFFRRAVESQINHLHFFAVASTVAVCLRVLLRHCMTSTWLHMHTHRGVVNKIASGCMFNLCKYVWHVMAFLRRINVTFIILPPSNRSDIHFTSPIYTWY